MTKNVILLISSILLVAVTFELLLQIIDYPVSPTYGSTYASGPNTRSNETNELGSRGKPLDHGGPVSPSSKVVVLISDSQVQCTACPFDQLPERRLEYYFNAGGHEAYQVFSIAASGWGQDQQLLMLQRFFSEHHAHKVVLWFTSHNDIWNNTFPSSWRWNGGYKPTYRLENEALVGPNAKMGDQVFLPKTYHLFRIVYQRLYNRIPRVWFNTALVQYGKYIIPGIDDVWSLRYLPVPRGMMNIDSCIGRSGVPKSNVDALDIYGPEQIWEEKSHFNVYSVSDTPRLSYGTRLTLSILEEIARETAKNNGDFMVFTTGELLRTQFFTRGLFARSEVVIAKLDGYCLELSYEAFSTRIRSLLAKFEYVDLVLDDMYSSDRDSHLSVPATDRAMKLLAEYILAREGSA